MRSLPTSTLFAPNILPRARNSADATNPRASNTGVTNSPDAKKTAKKERSTDAKHKDRDAKFYSVLRRSAKGTVCREIFDGVLA